MRFEKETNLYQDAAIANKFSSQDTQFNVVNGKISYLISESEIEEYEDKSKTVTSRLNSSEDSIDRHSQQISSLQTDIVGINGDIDTFKSEVNTFEQTTNSTISSITSIVATKTQVWTVQPTVPYLANDFWIRDNTLYVCTVSRSTGSFNNADWKPATKGRIFTSTPTTPYYSGDVYVQGNSGDILFCSATRLTGNYTASDWSKASKYTDDTAFNTWTQNTYNSFIEQLPSQINLQVTGSRDVNANTKYTSKASIIATINDQTFESGVRINADRITLDGDATINAINGATGNVVVNANKVNLNAYATFTALQTAGATTINGANIETGTITARQIGSRTITADNIASNTITANQIASETITSNKIASGTITADQIASKTITSDEIATGTITANEIATGTITADNIASGTITADKLDVNYLTASDVGDEGSTVISGSRITTGSINADLIKAGTLQSQDSVNYPNFSINLTDGTINIKRGGINLGNGSFVVDNDGNVTLRKGSITIGSNENFKVDKYGTVTMKSAVIDGYIKPDDVSENGNTTISGKRIATGSIDADKLSVRFLSTTDVGENGNTTISGSRITTGVIVGNNRNVVFDLTNGKLTMNNGSINIGNNFIVKEDGSAILKSVTVTGYDTSTSVTNKINSALNGYAKTTDLDDYVTFEDTNNFATKTGLKTSGYTTIDGSNLANYSISTYKIAAGAITAAKIAAYTITASEIDSGAITAAKIASGAITASMITAGKLKDSNEKVVLDLSNGTFTMKSGSINIASKFIVGTDGALTAKASTFVTRESGYNIKVSSNEMSFRSGTTEYAYINYDGNFANFLANSSSSVINLGVGNSIKFQCDSSGIYVSGKIRASGDKPRIVKTKDFDTRTLYCYETPSPMFGDIGESIINEDGYCYVNIDPIFLETVSKDAYYVFLQKCGMGDCYVYKTFPSYFIIYGTPKLKVFWEIKCKQFDWEHKRLTTDTIEYWKIGNTIPYDYSAKGYLDEKETHDYAEEALNHIDNVNKERDLL